MSSTNTLGPNDLRRSGREKVVMMKGRLESGGRRQRRPSWVSTTSPNPNEKTKKVYVSITKCDERRTDFQEAFCGLVTLQGQKDRGRKTSLDVISCKEGRHSTHDRWLMNKDDKDSTKLTGLSEKMLAIAGMSKLSASSHLSTRTSLEFER
jgi:hypothetical protein